MRSRSTALELTLLTVAVVSGLLAAYSWLALRWQKEWLLAEVERGLVLTSDALHRSLRWGMLQDRREEIHAGMERLAESTGIEAVRIIGHRGQFTVSTDPADRAKTVDRQSPACTGCHAAPGMVASHPPVAQTWTTLGSGRMRAFTPVLAETGCVTDACHPREQRSGVLGVLDLTLSLGEVETAMRRSQWRLLLLTAVAILVGAIVLRLVLSRRLRAPLRDLLAGIQRISKGDLSYRVPIRRHDEFGQVAESFSAMSRQLAAVQDQLVRSERLASMGILAAGVAHEINNPLGGILAFAEDLLDDTDPSDPLHKDYEVIVGEALRCRQIVRNLLDFSRQAPPSRTSVKPAELIEGPVDAMCRRQEFHRIRFECEYEPELPEISVDAVQLQQVLLNLIVNAQQAMPDGGTIVLGARRVDDGRYLELSIVDQGAGIQEETTARIFEPFFSTKGGQSAGLGLSVCLGIVEQHGGTIEVESEPGRGSRFRVLLPLDPDVRRRMGEQDDEPHPRRR